MRRLAASALVLVIAAGCAGTQAPVSPSSAQSPPRGSSASPVTSDPPPTPVSRVSMKAFLAAGRPAGTAVAMIAALGAANASAPAPAELASSLGPLASYCQTGDPKLRGVVSFVEDRRTECQLLVVQVWETYQALGTQEWLTAASAAYEYVSSQALGVPNATQPPNSVDLWRAHLDDYLLQLFP